MEGKLKLKAKYRGWGVVAVEGTKVYGSRHRSEYLKQVKQEAIRHQLERLYALLDAALEAQEQSLAEVVRLGRGYPEIAEFDKVPGVGVASPSTQPVHDLIGRFVGQRHVGSSIQSLWQL